MNKLILSAGLTFLSAAGCSQKPAMESPISQQTMNQEMTKPDNPYYSRTDTQKLDLPDSVWRKVLSEEVYHISREAGTERAFTGKYWDYEGLGNYYCGACGNHLFVSDAKFSSQCGWPSFFQPVRDNSVIYKEDHKYGWNRVEVICGRCDGHLGHVFEDGPPPTGLRYCMNSAVLDFEPLHH